MATEKTWRVLRANDDKVRALQSALRISPVLCRIMVERGIESFEEAKTYFRPSLDALHAPWLMKDMDRAVARIADAVDRREKILLLGDYDVDGTTAVASMYLFMQKIYEPSLIEYYIPNRYREGYGVSQASIDFASERGIRLIISLDCGIKSADLVGYASTLGIDFIICDHHLPDLVLPAAVAILNPKQPGCHYPYKELCGCGVGFKLITALGERMGLAKQVPFEYLDLVATAIAADIVPMTGENRVLAYYGLKKVNERPNYGIQALIQLSGVKKTMSINSLVFMIAPRVNAAGRMDDARKAVQMFIAAQFEEALHYAVMLHADNSDRKEADESMTEEALAMIEASETMMRRKSTVVFQPHWQKGVVGIVASRLIERYYRPTVVLTKSGGILAGSARSVQGFNLYEAVHACRAYLLGYGGHFAAAGLSLLPEQMEAFSLKFEEIVSATIAPNLLIPEIVIDSDIQLSEITPSFYNILCQMEPFGPENLRPVFLAKGVVNTGFSKVVKEDHIRFSLRQDHSLFAGIGFNMAQKFPLLVTGAPLDIVFAVDENEWNGQKSLQLKVIDCRPSDS